MIRERGDIQPALDHLESALHASCATLIALQSSRIAAHEMAHEVLAVEAQVSQAIAAVQEAIGELRAMHDIETTGLAFGFVLAADPGWAGAQARRRAAGRRQVRPRRTA